jgi:pimeloyl-ACP methyl ester carboxylesterase
MMITMLLKRLLCLLSILFMVSGCGIFNKPEPTITPFILQTVIAVPVDSDNLKYVECPFEEVEDIPREARADIRCANLTVPEDWQQPNGPKIKLAVAIVKTANTEPKPDPILVMIGNPGYGSYIAYVLPYIFENIFAQRDLIIVDQRGTGFSDPSIECTEISNLSIASNANLTVQEANDLLVEASRTCFNKVKAEGINLSDYTTTAEAADLDYLRQVLGISKWNIYSVLDGSRLALTMMREYPQVIRSVVLDSPVPLQANPVTEWGTNVERTFERFFNRCAGDVQCAKYYPDLEETFYTLLDQLDGEPIVFDVANQNSGERFKVSLDSERMITLFLLLLNTVNDRESLPEVPRMVYQLRDGKTEVVKQLMGRLPQEVLPSSAMDFWMDCNEESHFTTLEQVRTANANINPHLQEYFDAQAEGGFRACEEWKAPGVSDSENQPVASGIPTLLLAGEYDWTEPPEWAEIAAQTLRNSTVVEFPAIGQIVYASSQWSVCSHQIVEAFLETPAVKPDTSCASAPFKITWITLP